MSALPHDDVSQDDWLLDGFLRLNTPPGFRAELIESEIVVTPPPGGDHEVIIFKIVSWVLTQFPGLGAFGAVGLTTPGGHFIPDLTVAPEAAILGRSSWSEPAGEVEMVVEVTSSRPDLDREAKRRGYAAAGIPLYLLVDREEKQVTIFSDPRGDYHHWEAVLLGDKLRIPKPLDGVLDTAVFPVR